MKRRQFHRTLAGAMLLTATTAAPLPAHSAVGKAPQTVKPRRLRPGDTIGLITPGSYIPDDALEKAVSNMESLGFRVKMGANIRAERGFNAGTDEQRLSDLHAMFADPQVAAVWCARGGYGCSRLLPMMDFSLIAQNPKVLIGYSDVTALLNAIYQHTGLVGFHGPVAASEMTDYTREHLMAAITGEKAGHLIPLSEENQQKSEDHYQARTMRGGNAEGILAGGNLSLLAALTGTGFLPDLKEKLVFIEEVGERPYRIDRMLTQLRQASGIGHATGLALGIFADCQPKTDERSLSLADTLDDRLSSLGIPASYGLSFGHIANQCTLPVGIRARLDAEAHTITLLEPAVSS